MISANNICGLPLLLRVLADIVSGRLSEGKQNNIDNDNDDDDDATISTIVVNNVLMDLEKLVANCLLLFDNGVAGKAFHLSSI